MAVADGRAVTLFSDGKDDLAVAFDSASGRELWRYAIALPALLLAAAATRTNLVAAWRGGAWRIALVGLTLGAGQTITFWESIKTLDTSLAESRISPGLAMAGSR